ncbi:hypothetical protein DFQ27_005014 [Actinomortierella ambigua]|uniref:Thioredoxin-dependent peroxiredoxin n=1 Tax=Actinomortierella ambigua TaxID=1343610 RepID=A0A9P6Q098_9FUNG|nr:hypothetical protein DFQ27_005014 [Actinomortierella ambigua]
MIQVGNKIPESILTYIPYDPELKDACGIPQPLNTDEDWKDKKVVLFGLPGAFTPTCSLQHLPEYAQRYKEFKDKGVDLIVCLSTTDAFVMDAWGRSLGVKDKVLMVADGNGDFVKDTGLVLDLSAKRMGAIRSQRFAMVIDHLKVTYLGVEPGGGLTVSGASAVLAHL